MRVESIELRHIGPYERILIEPHRRPTVPTGGDRAARRAVIDATAIGLAPFTDPERPGPSNRFARGVPDGPAGQAAQVPER